MRALVLSNSRLLSLVHDLTKLADLREAGFAGDDRADCALDGRLLGLQVLDLLDEEGRILVWRQPVDAVEEDRAMVVRDQVSLPCLQQLLLQLVDELS